jgi:hypothetical protein
LAPRAKLDEDLRLIKLADLKRARALREGGQRKAKWYLPALNAALVRWHGYLEEEWRAYFAEAR